MGRQRKRGSGKRVPIREVGKCIMRYGAERFRLPRFQRPRYDEWFIIESADSYLQLIERTTIQVENSYEFLLVSLYQPNEFISRYKVQYDNLLSY